MIRKVNKIVQRVSNQKPLDPSPRGKRMSPEQIAELIRVRAFEIYLKRGNKPGDPTNDWLKAEKLVKQELHLG